MDSPGDTVTLRLAEGNGFQLGAISGIGIEHFEDIDSNPAALSVCLLLRSLARCCSNGTPFTDQAFSLCAGEPLVFAPRSLSKSAQALVSGKYKLEMDMRIGVPPATGAGWGVSATAAALLAANRLLGGICTLRELLLVAMEAERSICGEIHPDLTVPALYGEFCIVRSYSPLDVITIPVPDELCCALVSPDLEVPTEVLRAALPDQVPLNMAISQAGNAASLVAGLLQSNWSLIAASCRDYLAEPYRAPLIRGFPAVRLAAMEEGALGVGISGVGPGIFALARGMGNAEKIAAVMSDAFKASGVNSRTYVSKVAGGKPQIIEETLL